ncbi:MFS transporter [Candidatus Bathyarchaeota archaeon]|nr:MFS transporter [Candidatus Bathyarchaeota archaeon]MBT4319420.1 MFS transporter [Candidatus Bathyarchaeota archaeon]MBT4422942.1 MFS transporter [Candidatus Bathyarchaeota archaeon]MBT7187273.1 MFS transporter [Candidatus Bathyarchaeota archaeon]MBT7346348.1 MFS transporter [Candidatus Bathyarchaeota archaeon]
MADKSLNAFRVLLLSVFMAMVGLGIISPIMPNYASDLGASGIYIGLIYSSFSLSRAALQTPIGRLADTFSKKKIIVAGLVMYAVISVVYTYVTSPEMLIVVRFFHGVGSSMMMPVAMAYAMNLTPKGEEGKYMGYLNTALFSGFGAGPFIGGYIYENYNTNMVFNTMTVLVLFSLTLTILLVPDEESLGMKRRKEPVPIRVILANRTLTSILIYRAVNALGRGTIMSFLPLYVVQILGLSSTYIGVILSTGIFLNAFLQTPMGILADRVNKKALLIGGGLLSAVGYVYLVQTGTITEIFVARMVVSMGSALAMPAVTAIIAKEGRELGSGSTVGVFNTAMSIGQIIGPIFSGFLLDAYGMGSVFYFSGFISVLSVVSLWIMSRDIGM